MATLITGTPGSGKTTLVAYAKSVNDNRFYDADEIDGLCEWRDFASGKSIGLVQNMTVELDDDWFKKNGWYWRGEVLKKFVATHPDAFICGSSENIADFYGLFERIIILRKTEAELLQNFQSPERLNPFGKTTKQRSGFMEWQDYLIAEAKDYPTQFIDGNEIAKTYHSITKPRSQSVKID